MALACFDHNIFNNVFLAVKNDVPELTKVLNDILSVKISINYSVIINNFKVGIFDKLFDDWVEDTVELTVLWQPWSAAETESRIWILQEVDHVVECKVFLSTYFSLKWHVLGVDIGSVLPEGWELLDWLVLFYSVLILKIFNDHIREDSWNKKVKFFKMSDNVLSINFVLQNLPEVLNNLFAMSMSCLPICLLIILLRVLQLIENLLLEHLWMVHQPLVEFIRNVLRISNEPLNVHEGTTTSNVAHVIKLEYLDKYWHWVKANVC